MEASSRGLELLEAIGELHGEHHADGQAGEGHHWNRVHPHGLELVQQVLAIEGALEDGGEGPAGQDCEIAKCIRGLEHACAGLVD